MIEIEDPSLALTLTLFMSIYSKTKYDNHHMRSLKTTTTLVTAADGCVKTKS